MIKVSYVLFLLFCTTICHLFINFSTSRLKNLVDFETNVSTVQIILRVKGIREFLFIISYILFIILYNNVPPIYQFFYGSFEKFN